MKEVKEDQQQWLSIAAVVLVIAGLGYFLFRQSRQAQEPVVETAEEVAEERAKELLDSMKVEVPEQAEKATLKDVAGGSGAGVATRVDEDGGEEYSVLAALPEPEGGKSYEAYLVGEGEGNEVYLGKLREAKGGWMLEYKSDTDLTEYKKVKVTLEEVEDKMSEQPVLEGEFKE